MADDERSLQEWSVDRSWSANTLLDDIPALASVSVESGRSDFNQLATKK